jgi:hypothetical protein
MDSATFVAPLTRAAYNLQILSFRDFGRIFPQREHYAPVLPGQGRIDGWHQMIDVNIKELGRGLTKTRGKPYSILHPREFEHLQGFENE